MKSVGSALSIPFRSKKPGLHATLKKPVKLWSEDRNRSDLDSDLLGSLRSGSSLRMSVVEKGRRGALKDVERSVELPEKCLMLCKFFNVIVSVIPLLRIRRKSSTFTNICPKIQSLTDRRFTINHLAQLKYVLPEAILVKRIRVRDEQTDCMKEDFLVTLDMEALEASKNMKDIREIFQARVEDYYKTHTEENDIPEGELPALFCQSLSIDKSSCVTTASHVPPLFQRSFSRHTQALSESSTPLNVLATPVKDDVSFTTEFSKETRSLLMKDGSEGVVDSQGTPAKEALSSVQLMATLPALKSSKRCHMRSGDDTCDIPTKLVRRSLMIDALEDDDVPEVQAGDALGSSFESDIIDLLPENLLQSVRENERKILEEQDPAISQARRRHQLMSGIPKLVDMINILFHYINRSVMSKEELIYKLIISHCEIVDRGEVEEQFKLLQELAPEYISERLCSSGDTLVGLNRSVSAESVHAKLHNLP